jgi:hypothetical protein
MNQIERDRVNRKLDTDEKIVIKALTEKVASLKFEIKRLKVETARLEGEFIGTLKAITFWNIPKELKDKLEERIVELEKIRDESCKKRRYK